MVRKKWLAGILAIGIALPILPSHAYMAPVNPIVAATPGAWSAGETPPNLSPDKPVILFVHGLTSQAKIWYEDNDMYQYAYNNGYQTAFINMYDITGTPEDMWKDGELLASKIKEISQRYGGKKIVIVAHSKGGVDTQAALVRYNAYPYVSRVITLSTPHHGSELADLAYSSWAGWLADLVGSQSPGTSSLQTSYMKYFRSEMNKDPDVNKVPFYTMSGDKWSGSNKASYTFGGAYLALFGSNDGVVTTASAMLPGATLIRSGPWNHATVRTGSYTFDLFKPYIGTVSGTAGSTASAVGAFSSSRALSSSVSKNVYRGDATVSGNVYGTPSDTPSGTPVTDSSTVPTNSSHPDATADAPLPNGHLYVRGGQSTGTATEALTVEDGVRSITIDWLSSKPLRELQLIAPDGTRQQVQVQSAQDDDIFKGAYHQIVELPTPVAGNWKVRGVGDGSGAYLMTAVYDSSTIQASMHTSVSSDTLDMQLQTEGLRSEGTIAKSTIDYYDTDGKQIAPPTTTQRSLVAGQLETSIPNPSAGKPSSYVITTDISGVTAAGKPYKRTLIKSVYVDANGQTYSE